MSDISQVGELEQRVMIFSKAFQDLLGEIMKLKQENESYRKQIAGIKEELSSLKSKMEQERRVEPKKEKIKKKYKKARKSVEKS